MTIFDPAEQRGKTPVSLFSAEEMAEALAARRQSRVERAKEILQICRGVNLNGTVGDVDLSDEAIAQRLADLIWE